MIDSLEDTEHITVIETISAEAVTIDLFIVVKKAVIQIRWFADFKFRDIAIDVSESDYSNDELFFLWLQHWNWLSKHHQKETYHLLIVDEYDSHLIFQFLWYCKLHKMIVLQLSSHSTHFLQSLDVVIFQQWKHWHTKTIDFHICKSINEFNHQIFLANLEFI